MGLLTGMKNFLSDRPLFAILALLIVSLAYLFRKYDRAQQAHLETLSKIAPLVEKLVRVVNKAKNKLGDSS